MPYITVHFLYLHIGINIFFEIARLKFRVKCFRGLNERNALSSTYMAFHSAWAFITPGLAYYHTFGGVSNWLWEYLYPTSITFWIVCKHITSIAYSLFL